MQNTPKVYAPITIKEKHTKFGAILAGSFSAEKMIEFCHQNKNEKGYVNLNIQSRQKTGEYGDTHYAVLNTWQPTPQPKANQANQDDLP